MSNPSASRLYSLLDAYGHNGGVSGFGTKESFSVEQLEKAVETLLRYFDVKDLMELKTKSLDIDDEQIINFLSNCLRTAKEEDDVEIAFM